MSHSQLRNDAMFLQQQQQSISTTTTATTSIPNNNNHNTNNNTNSNQIASLQVRNRLQLQVQHLLSSSSSSSTNGMRLYPWRYGIKSKKRKSYYNNNTNNSISNNNHTIVMDDIYDYEEDEMMIMQQWWKQTQAFIQEHVTSVLVALPARLVIGTERPGPVLTVVPFPSTLDPPWTIMMHTATTTTTTTTSTVVSNTKPIVTIPMTVLLPIPHNNSSNSDNHNNKHEYKNGIYFQQRQMMIQQIATLLQSKTIHQVTIQDVDVRKSCIVLQMCHGHHHTKKGPHTTIQESSSSSSSSSYATLLHQMQKYYTLQIVLHFQMQNIDWIQLHHIVRLLPNRNNNTNSINNTNDSKHHSKHGHEKHSINDSLTGTKMNLHSDNLPPHHLQQQQQPYANTYSVQYNYAITEDMIHVLDQQQQQQQNRSNDTHAIALSNMTIRHGITLIILWCTQRGLYQPITTTDRNGSTNTNHLYTKRMTTPCYFNDTIIVQIIQYLIYTKRILVSSSNKDPMTILIAFLTLLSETQWELRSDANQYHSDDNETNIPLTNPTGRKQLSQRQQRVKIQQQHHHRTVLIQPHYIGQSTNEIIQSSVLAQRYASMIQDELKFQLKKKNPLQQGPDGKRVTPPPLTLVEFLASTTCIQTPTLFHPSLQHNYLFRLSNHFMRSAQLYAKKSLACIYPTSTNITISHTDPFHHLFRQSATSLSLMLQHSKRKDVPSNDKTASSHQYHQPVTNTMFYTLYDAYVRIPLSEVIDPRSSSTTPPTTPSIYGHHWMDDIRDLGYDEALLRGILRTLRYALNDRIVNIQAIIVENTNEYNDNRTNDMDKGTKNEEKQKMKKKIGNHDVISTKFIVIGVTINPDTCYRVVDRCMTAEADMSHSNNSIHELPQQQKQSTTTMDNQPPHTSAAVREFLALWGRKAGLRRFKDGAIVYAVVWDDKSNVNTENENTSSLCLRYHNDDTWQGGIVESIIRHVLKEHFLKPASTIVPRFLLRDLVSMIDGVIPTNSSSTGTANTSSTLPSLASPLLSNPMLAHRSVMKAFDSLSSWLRTNSIPTIPIPGSATAMQSVLGIPLTIDRVEPLSPALRYVALYPPIPHPLLIAGANGQSSTLGQKKCSGAVQSDPIAVQICFGSSSKWPNDIKAIGAAKTAMLIEIVNGIVQLKKSGVGDTVCQLFNEKSILVTPTYADIPFMGYVFRVTIKADHEIRILQKLQNPSRDAERMLQSSLKRSIISAKHHALIHGVYTNHPSSSATVRLAKRWLSSHLLSSDSDDGYCIPFEVIELTVAHVYTNQSNLLRPPATLSSGFMRWLYLIIDHSWQDRPLVVDPQNHLNDADHCTILDQFERDRGENFDRGPAWYIVAPYDGAGKIDAEGSDENTAEKTKNRWSPSFSFTYPERVVASRIAALAQRTYTFLQSALMRCEENSKKLSDSIWHRVFQESRDSFLSYSVLLRIDPSFLVNVHASSSAHVQNLLPHKERTKAADGSDLEVYESTYVRSMVSISLGPKDLQKKMYRNLMIEGDYDENNLHVLTEWQPIRAMLQLLRSRLGKLLLIFYNDQHPDVVGVVWRQPNMFQSRPFSALTSEFARPVVATAHLLPDTMISYNTYDVLRTTSLYTFPFVTDVKVFDNGNLDSLSKFGSGSRTPEGSSSIDTNTSKKEKNTKRQRVDAAK